MGRRGRIVKIEEKRISLQEENNVCWRWTAFARRRQFPLRRRASEHRRFAGAG